MSHVAKQGVDAGEQSPPPLPPAHFRPNLESVPAGMLDFLWSENELKMKELVDVIEKWSHRNDEIIDDVTARYVSYASAGGGNYSTIAETPKTIRDRKGKNRRLDCGILCKVTAGYRGDEPMYQIGADEMYWVSGIERQQRMVTKDSKGRFLSIPLNYQRKFSPSFDGHRYEKYALTLAELRDEMNQSGRELVCLMVENDEPVLLHIGPSGPSGKPAERLGPLTVVDTYDEKYVIAFSVANGEVCSKTSSIPVHMTIEVTIAEDFDSAVCSDFREWMKESHKVIDKVQLRKIPMCQEIIIFNDLPDSNHDYDYVEPAAFIVENRQTHDKGDNYRTYEEIRQCIEKTSAIYIDHPSTRQTREAQLIRLPLITRKNQHIQEPVHDERSPDVPPPRPPRYVSHEGRSTGHVDVNNKGAEHQPPPLLPRNVKRQPSSRAGSISRQLHDYEQCDAAGTIEPRNQLYTRIVTCEHPTGLDNYLPDETMTSWVDLSSADLIRYLRLLHLDKYATVVESHRFEGKHIAAMSEQLLINNLKFAHKDAVLLRFFIENDWYPPFKCRPNPLQK